jgi:hypothetical protein
MVAVKSNGDFQEHLADRILGRLCEAAELVTLDLVANRNRLRELVDELAFELDAGDLAIFTLAQGSATADSPDPRRCLTATAASRS